MAYEATILGPFTAVLIRSSIKSPPSCTILRKLEFCCNLSSVDIVRAAPGRVGISNGYKALRVEFPQ